MISPRTRTANPGPGNGCLWTILSGKPNVVPTSLTSSLYNSCNGSIIFSFRPCGNVTLWCDFIFPLLSIQSGAIVP